jgi:hypothetical protein
MSKTATELADAVLRELGVVDAEETPDTVDRTYVSGVYTDKYEELLGTGRELAYWPEEEIPEAIFLAMRNLLMLEVQGAYGEPVDPVEKEARESVLLRAFHRHTARGASGTKAVAAADYF